MRLEQEIAAPVRAEDLPKHVGIRALDTEEGTIRSYLASTQAMPGESLIGWLARVGELNAHRSLSKSLAKVGIVTHGPSSVAMTPDVSERVSFLLKSNLDEVIARTHVPIDATGPGLIDFFGVPVRSHYISTSGRRVSPRALAISGHHRAVWSLRPLSFDPETMETLIHACPVCGGNLGWKRTAGVCFCDRCIDRDRRPKVDLRDFPQPLVEVKDRKALGFVVTLVDPLCKAPLTPAGGLHPLLDRFSRGELFDLAVQIAAMIENSLGPNDSDFALKFSARDGAIGLSPDALARAGRALINWPDTFFSIADNVRGASTGVETPFGGFDEIRPMVLLRRAFSGNDRLSGLLEETLMGYVIHSDADDLVARRRTVRVNSAITTLAASARFRIKRTALQRLADSGLVKVARHKKIVVFDADEIEPIIAERNTLVDRLEAATRLGVPLGSLPDLASYGLLEKVEGPVLTLLREQEQYRSESLEALVARLAAAPVGVVEEAQPRLTLDVSRLSVGPKPWGAIVQAILDGNLLVRSLAGGKRAGVLNQFAADISELAAVAGRAAPPTRANPDERTNYAEASDYFGVHESVFGELTARGILPRYNLINLRLRRGDLAEFAEKYFFTEEIARRLGRPKKDVVKELRSAGIEPFTGALAKKTWLWLREDVEAYLRGVRLE